MSEIARRARYLAETRGSLCTFDNGRPFSWRELHLEDYYIILTDRGRLSIRTGVVREICVLVKEESRSPVETAAPYMIGACLETLRRAMLLEDLADV